MSGKIKIVEHTINNHTRQHVYLVKDFANGNATEISLPVEFDKLSKELKEKIINEEFDKASVELFKKRGLK